MPTEEQTLFAQLMVVSMLLECIRDRLSNGKLNDEVIQFQLTCALNIVNSSLNDMKTLLNKPAEPKQVCY